MCRLEFLRRQAGLTQEQLARKLFYSRNMISWLERERPGSELVNIRLRRAVEDYFAEPFETLMEAVRDAPRTGDAA